MPCPSSRIGPMEHFALQAAAGIRHHETARRTNGGMAPRQWLPRPVVTTSFPPVIQLVEPKKLTSRTTSIPHLFCFCLSV